jgi:hypothetical protein
MKLIKLTNDDCRVGSTIGWNTYLPTTLLQYDAGYKAGWLQTNKEADNGNNTYGAQVANTEEISGSKRLRFFVSAIIVPTMLGCLESNELMYCRD